MNVQLVVPAAGIGQRLGAPLPKALVDLCGLPLLVRTLQRFERARCLDAAIILAPPDALDDFRELFAHHFPAAQLNILPGGALRQDSVALGLDELHPEAEIVLIHDAARPFISPETIRHAIEAAATHGAATVAIPCIDTILLADEGGFLEDTPDRARTWACQTPQTFRTAVIREAHARARADRYQATDDASLVRRMGHPVKLVPGSRFNIKVTTPEDLALAEFIIEKAL